MYQKEWKYLRKPLNLQNRKRVGAVCLQCRKKLLATNYGNRRINLQKQ
jgi:hypothetical protein